MTLPQPAADLDVQLGRIIAGMADLQDQVAGIRASQDSWREQWAHYSRKIDEIHRTLFVGNGGQSIKERLATLEATSPLQYALLQGKVETVADLADVKATSVKEGAIDWKWLAMLVLNVLIAALVATNRM